LIRIAAHAQGAEVIVEIIDQGCGIPEARLGKVFDPFFTTKSPGEGTGLGLALVYSIVTGMGGSVTAESPVDPRTGRGTRMVLRFEALTAT
jgi:signal transduction histidine kinase